MMLFWLLGGGSVYLWPNQLRICIAFPLLYFFLVITSCNTPIARLLVYCKWHLQYTNSQVVITKSIMQLKLLQLNGHANKNVLSLVISSSRTIQWSTRTERLSECSLTVASFWLLKTWHFVDIAAKKANC